MMTKAEIQAALTTVNWRLLIPVFLMIVIIDQGTKHYFDSTYAFGVPVDVIGDVVRFKLIHNDGIAFGIQLFENRFIFVLFSILVVVFVFFYVITLPLKPGMQTWVTALIIGGAIGNIIDRAVLGYVIDFIDVDIPDLFYPVWTSEGLGWSDYPIERWFIFNVADSAISVGMVIVIIRLSIDSIRNRFGASHQEADKGTDIRSESAAGSISDD